MAEMSRREREIRRNVRAVRVQDLLRVLEDAGFSCRVSSGGHHVCRHSATGTVLTFAEPHGSGEKFIRPTYVSRALKALDAVREAAAIEDDNDAEE